MKIARFIAALLFFSLVFTGANAQAIKATIDPSELATGSRPLGLGRAYVGLADDVYSLFQNPAGLTGIKRLQTASMYSKFIQDVDYSLLGVANPMSREALGLAYLKASVSGSQLTRRDPVTDRIVPEGEGAIGYTSSVWFLSYALEPEKYLSFPALKDVSLGCSLKIFNQSLTGLVSRDVNALGTDLDLGIQYRPVSWLGLGAAGYNVLPYDMGGRLIWASGINESIPASAKLGAEVKLLGAGGLKEIEFFPQDLLLCGDYEIAFSGARPGLFHLGVEWFPWEILSLRAGLDQDAVATGTDTIGIDNNLSAGIGLNLFNLRFDYAFHTFGALSANDTHFFSITYGIEPKRIPTYVPVQKPPLLIEVTWPGEKYRTFDPYVVLKGKITNPDQVREVKVGSLAANYYDDGSFVAVVKLEQLGRNKLEVLAISQTGRIIETKTLNYVRLASFVDVKEGDPLKELLGKLGAMGYVSGFKDGTFRPKRPVTRADLCALLIRITATQEVLVPRHSNFEDFSIRHWAAKYIAEAVRQKLVQGFPGGFFKPNQVLTRGEAISVLVSFAGLEDISPVYEKPFEDIPTKHWAARAIYLAKKHGFLDYIKEKKFNPESKMTRREVVLILNKMEFVSKKLDALLE